MSTEPAAEAAMGAIVSDTGASHKGEWLWRAASVDDAATVRLALRSGADPNWKNKVAVHSGHVAASRALLEAGAAVHPRGKGGEKPLHYAAIHGHRELTTLLLGAGSDVGVRDLDSATPLHRAAGHGCLGVAQALLEAGAEVCANNKYGATPLHKAAALGRVKITGVLIDAGATVDAEDTHGFTPLHNAAAGGHLAVVPVLLDAGADVDSTDKDGWTPLHRAAYMGHIGVVRALLKAGADWSLEITNSRKRGMSAMACARAKGFDVVADLIHDWRHQWLVPQVVALWASKGCAARARGDSDHDDDASEQARLRAWRGMPRNVVAEVLTLLVPPPVATAGDA